VSDADGQRGKQGWLRRGRVTFVAEMEWGESPRAGGTTEAGPRNVKVKADGRAFAGRGRLQRTVDRARRVTRAYRRRGFPVEGGSVARVSSVAYWDAGRCRWRVEDGAGRRLGDAGGGGPPGGGGGVTAGRSTGGGRARCLPAGSVACDDGGVCWLGERRPERERR